MSKAFHELPEEKQMRIINAAMEVFAQNDYRKASTDDIAAKAGISKGSLFYYFQNKKKLYLYLYEYVGDMMKGMLDEDFLKITDFFELMSYGADLKLRIIQKNPYLVDFVLRCFYSKDEPVAEELDLMNEDYISSGFHTYLKNIDFSKFREDANPVKVYQMLVWMADGYMHEKRRCGKKIEISAMMAEFEEWKKLLKPLLYKEEYL